MSKPILSAQKVLATLFLVLSASQQFFIPLTRKYLSTNQSFHGFANPCNLTCCSLCFPPLWFVASVAVCCTSSLSATLYKFHPHAIILMNITHLFSSHMNFLLICFKYHLSLFYPDGQFYLILSFSWWLIPQFNIVPKHV